MTPNISTTLTVNFSWLVILAVGIFGCTPKGKTGDTAGAQNVNEVVPTELKVFSWADYLPPAVIEEFEKENSLKVSIDYFSSNEELLTKVQSSVESASRGYDLIIPSDYMASAMSKMGLLTEVPHDEVPSLKEFSKDFLNPSYNPGLKFVVPYAWGTTALAVNTKLLPSFDSSQLSWAQFFEAKSPLKGKTSWLDDMREVAHAALLANGKKWSSATEDDLKLAFDYLKTAKKNFKIFTPESRPVMEGGDCAVCMGYSGDILQIARDKKFLKYVLPKEGATIWADNLAVPKNAAAPKMAFRLINKLISAQGAKTFVETLLYASPNQKAFDLLSPELKINKAIFPSPEDFSKLTYLMDRPELMGKLESLWTELKATQ